MLLAGDICQNIPLHLWRACAPPHLMTPQVVQIQIAPRLLKREPNGTYTGGAFASTLPPPPHYSLVSIFSPSSNFCPQRNFVPLFRPSTFEPLPTPSSAIHHWCRSGYITGAGQDTSLVQVRIHHWCRSGSRSGGHYHTNLLNVIQAPP